mgnify:FL=1|jgi:hypothetical protein
MLKEGDLVEHMFVGTYGYGIILEKVEKYPARYRVRWVDGSEQWESPRDIILIGEA